MDYKAAIEESLTQLQKLEHEGGDSWKELEGLKLEAKSEKNPRKLFMMYQSLREIIAQESDEEVDTTFHVEGEDGKRVTYQNLDDFYRKQDLTKSRPTTRRRRI